MSAVEPQKPVEAPAAGTTEPAPAPVEPVPIDIPVASAPEAEESKPEGETAAPVEEKNDETPETKAIEPILSGALGYKGPGLKNAFRFSKKYFWFGEEAVPASNLREYLRGEKPEVAHSVAAWSSQTGKGLLFFVKNADQKEHPAGVLNLAYATDLHKDGTQVLTFKISGSKHTFEAETAAERDGWYVAIEKAISEAQEAKEGIESSEAYKEQKEKIGKPTTLTVGNATAPKKSSEAAETTAVTSGEEVVAAPPRAGSSSSSSDGEKKAKKSKSRSASRKRASIFGGLLGKKEKAEEKAEQKTEGDSKVQPETTEETTVAEGSATAPAITSDTPEVSEELKDEAAPAATVPAPVDEVKSEETTSKPVEEKPKPTKRASIFGSFFEKVKSPIHEKKEAELVTAPVAKDTDTTPEASKPLEEALVAVPSTTEPASELSAGKADEKPAAVTPTKEKAHFTFGNVFGRGSKDRAKSPAATDKTPASEPSKVEDAPASTATEHSDPTVAAPAVETKSEKDEKKRSSIFGSLGRSLSKATKSKDTKEAKKEAAPPTVPEASESKDDLVAPVVDDKKDDTPVVPTAAEQTIGDVAPGAINVGEAPKSTSAVPTPA
ncbi:Pleckstrin homology domain-containing protein [Ampelomyces quisqualis]|uniref:Pleckstrin homology domain-containing protein n=1 Tax=Ampelomyces quisqualis TaxID=50730 RepID=A0A6A5QK48_AMPQU|nr:Pleckstrin homology domain-containing protein [Ampelomyces quisqualis]